MSPRARVYLVLGVAAAFFVAVATGAYFAVSYFQGQNLNARAHREMTNAHYDAAIALYDAASRKNLDATTLALVYGNRGWCYTKKGNDEQAIRDFAESIRLDPLTALSRF
jgi:tetratricopeptide (TPR) repeat protein